MNRTITYAERNAFTEGPRVVGVEPATPTEIFPDHRQSRGEIAVRFLQNLTGDRLFVSFNLSAANGVDPQADNVGMFHTMLEDGQLLDCLPSRERVCVYSVGGGPVSTRLVYRTDLGHTQQVP